MVQDTTHYDDDENEIDGYWETIYAMSVVDMDSETTFFDQLRFYEQKFTALRNLLLWAEELPDITTKEE